VFHGNGDYMNSQRPADTGVSLQTPKRPVFILTSAAQPSTRVSSRDCAHIHDTAQYLNPEPLGNDGSSVKSGPNGRGRRGDRGRKQMDTAVVCRSRRARTTNARNLEVRSLNMVKFQVIPRRSDSRGYRVGCLLRGSGRRNKMKNAVSRGTRSLITLRPGGLN